MYISNDAAQILDNLLKETKRGEWIYSDDGRIIKTTAGLWDRFIVGARSIFSPSILGFYREKALLSLFDNRFNKVLEEVADLENEEKKQWFNRDSEWSLYPEKVIAKLFGTEIEQALQAEAGEDFVEWDDKTLQTINQLRPVNSVFQAVFWVNSYVNQLQNQI